VEAVLLAGPRPLEPDRGSRVIAGASLGDWCILICVPGIFLMGIGPETYAQVLKAAEEVLQDQLVDRAARLLEAGNRIPGGHVWLRGYKPLSALPGAVLLPSEVGN